MAAKVEAKGGGKLCEDTETPSLDLFCEDSLKETMPCNEMDCSLDPEARDCHLSIWADWSECTTSCGQGLRTRSREVAAAPLLGGLGCSADLKQALQRSFEACPMPGGSLPQASLRVGGLRVPLS